MQIYIYIYIYIYIDGTCLIGGRGVILVGHVASVEDKIIAYRVLVRKPGGKRNARNGRD
jgi:hypothetical protein